MLKFEKISEFDPIKKTISDIFISPIQNKLKDGTELSWYQVRFLLDIVNGLNVFGRHTKKHLWTIPGTAKNKKYADEITQLISKDIVKISNISKKGKKIFETYELATTGFELIDFDLQLLGLSKTEFCILTRKIKRIYK